jgi:hypothetical protein
MFSIPEAVKMYVVDYGPFMELVHALMKDGHIK